MRSRALETASGLFYRHGVRAIGMDQIVEESGIAKTTIYRHFPTKDALIEAFLEKEDAEFWAQWDEVVDSAATSLSRLDALCEWVGERVSRVGYRGCPQINVAAEFADPLHPARVVGRRHKAAMADRLEELCRDTDAADPCRAAMQVALLFDGAFMSGGRLDDGAAAELLRHAVRRIVAP